MWEESTALAPMMKKSIPAPHPDAYVEALSGWQRITVEKLRSEVLAAAAALDEVIKWGHLVYLSNGPLLLIRAEEHRVLFGFWRGKRLREIEPRLKPGGKYEMATVELHQDDEIASGATRHLVKEAIGLNKTLGIPRRSRDGLHRSARGHSRGTAPPAGSETCRRSTAPTGPYADDP